MASWVETSRDLVLKTFLFRVFRVGFRSHASGKEGCFDVLETKDWVNVVPITAAGEALMVRQFRYGIGDDTLEFPAGTLEDGEDPAVTARRELAEETGASGGTWHSLGWCHPNPAFLSNRCHHFAVEGVSVTGATQFDEHEEIELVRIPLDRVDELIRAGKITHSLTIVSWHLWKSRPREPET